MAALTAATAVLAMLAASLGWGLAVLGGYGRLTRLERVVWATILGMGVQGWVMFPMALLIGANWESAALVTAAGLALLIQLRRLPAWEEDGGRPQIPSSPNAMTWLLLAVLVVVVLLDVSAGLVPPADADSMAYHFALPKRYLAEGEINFLPQAVEGAIPLLFHMTYMQALALGGEMGMTLWCTATSWLLPLGAYAAIRRYVSLEWALTLVVLVKSMPAVVYGSPSGQIEVRLAAMFLVAIFLASRARTDECWIPAAVVGMAAGFCAGAKYSGLVAVAVCGLAMLGSFKKWRQILAFGIMTVMAGSQWYLWNWYNTGDPVFPLLWQIVPYMAGAHWDADMAETFRQTVQGEASVPKNFAWLFLYPLKASFDGLQSFDSGRTGFGPLPILLLPFALIGWWPRRHNYVASELMTVFVLSALGYIIWYQFGSSQRIRHFLPELVPLLVLMVIAASRVTTILRPSLSVGLAVVMAIHLSGLLIYSKNNIEYFVTGEKREDYLRRNISAYPLAEWVNLNLRKNDKLLISQREIIYHIDVPVHYAAPLVDGRVKLFPQKPDTLALSMRLRGEGITHLALPNLYSDNIEQNSTFNSMVMDIINAGCASVQSILYVRPMLLSRTLGVYADGVKIKYYIIRIDSDVCANG